MNYNFANWELTQLLPEINPYVNYDTTQWTWEDIRLYLLKNNYYIVIDIKEVEDEIKYESIIYTKDKNGELICSKSYFSNTYEECRILAIKHCLTFLKLMNNGK